ncbi:hypothetical protein CBR_g88101, partial [Chara braunii]
WHAISPALSGCRRGVNVDDVFRCWPPFCASSFASVVYADAATPPPGRIPLQRHVVRVFEIRPLLRRHVLRHPLFIQHEPPCVGAPSRIFLFLLAMWRPFFSRVAGCCERLAAALPRAEAREDMAQDAPAVTMTIWTTKARIYGKATMAVKTPNEKTCSPRRMSPKTIAKKTQAVKRTTLATDAATMVMTAAMLNKKARWRRWRRRRGCTLRRRLEWRRRLRPKA